MSPEQYKELAVLIVKAAVNSIAVRGKIVVNMAAQGNEISNLFKELEKVKKLISTACHLVL